jgi:hypothetical protein
MDCFFSRHDLKKVVEPAPVHIHTSTKIVESTVKNGSVTTRTRNVTKIIEEEYYSEEDEDEDDDGNIDYNLNEIDDDDDDDGGHHN